MYINCFKSHIKSIPCNIDCDVSNIFIIEGIYTAIALFALLYHLLEHFLNLYAGKTEKNEKLFLLKWQTYSETSHFHKIEATSIKYSKIFLPLHS